MNRTVRRALSRWTLPLYRRTVGRTVNSSFHMDLMLKTRNFADVRWLGTPVWQSVTDLWTIQETISEVKPSLLVETGTHRGGSALFYAHLFDLMGHGRVITIDIENMHDVVHPRITFLVGDSTSQGVIAQVFAAVDEVHGPVMAILDSDHSQAHVAAELEAYAPIVSPGSFFVVQDGVVDVLPIGRPYRPGPLPAIRAFLDRHAEFEVDRDRTERFLITQHPMGWLRRKPEARVARS